MKWWPFNQLVGEHVNSTIATLPNRDIGRHHGVDVGALR